MTAKAVIYVSLPLRDAGPANWAAVEGRIRGLDEGRV